MAVTVATSPEYPTREAKLAFTCTGGGDFVQVFLTDAPLGSAYKTRLQNQNASQLLLFSGNSSDSFTLKVDKGGKYVLSVLEFTKGATAHGGGYATAPDGYQTETKISTSAVSVTFGTRLTMPVGTSEDRATLVIWVWDDTIRETSFDVHGEKSPELINPNSARARNATLSSNVISALAVLIDDAATAALTSLSATINDLRTKINAHLTNGVHSPTDTSNTIALSYSSSTSPKGASDAAAEIAKRLRLHMQTDSGTGVQSGAWHKTGGNATADLANLPIADVDARRPGLLNLVADCWRAYEAHRANTTPHGGSADSTNIAADLPPLLNLCRRFFEALATASPTTPSTENAAVTYLVQNAGMSEG